MTAVTHAGFLNLLTGNALLQFLGECFIDSIIL
jgi:hypothetical protein